MKSKQWKIQANKDKALMLAQRQLSEFVYDAVNLEGINMTLPEVQTLRSSMMLINVWDAL
jgi:hypothetical protein